MDLELDTPTSVEVAVESAIDEIDNLVVSIDGTDALEVTFDSNEFSIVGDDMVVVTSYDNAPQWLKNIIDNTVNIKTAAAVGDLNSVRDALHTLLGELEVAKNTYTLSIISSADIDSRITTAITTLNSSLQDADATILQIAQTAVTPSEASAIALNVLSASLSSNGEIGSALLNLQEVMTTLSNTTATSISFLESVMEGEIAGNSNAMTTLRTYVGIDESGGMTGTGLLANVSILQKQTDGIIETITGTHDVMLNPKDPNLAELVVTAEPYKTWKAADTTGMNTRLAHIGDVYIKYSVTSNGAKQYIGSYKFIRTVVDVTDAHHSTDADGFTWALIVDQASQDAYTQALNAYDLADGKRRVFTNTPSGPYDIGDLWTKTSANGSTLYKSSVKRATGYLAADWVVADDAGLNTFVNTTYTPTVTSLQNQVDGKVESWYTLSTSDPKTAWTDAVTRAKHDGDMWYQTNTFLSYWYSSATHSWNLIEDKAARDALENAATAQATADGVVVSYYALKQNTAPATNYMWLNTGGIKVLKEYTTSWVNVDVKEGDTLTTYDPVTKDTSVYVYYAGGWVTNTENGIVATSSSITELNGYLRDPVSGKFGGNSTLENSITTKANLAGKSAESKFQYGSSLELDGVTYNTGFGLATSLTSGSGLPVGQSEFWIKADKFKLMSADGSRKSSYSPFTVDSGTGDINFNGKVSFNNVNGVPIHSSGTTSPTIGTNPSLLPDGSTYYNTSSKSGYIVSGGVWINNSSITNTTSLIPEATITSTSLPGSTIKNQGTIWRYQPNTNMPRYIHYISKGGGIWTEVGGTYIDGSNIVTGSINASLITAGTMSSDRISASNLSAISANLGIVNAGVIYDNTYSTSGGASYKMKIDLNNGSIYIK